jgi:hypothetical protein
VTPVFDARSELVGWYDGRDGSDLRRDSVALQHGGYPFSCGGAGWPGPAPDPDGQAPGGEPCEISKLSSKPNQSET